MISLITSQKSGLYATLSAYDTAVALEKACHEYMKKTVPRYNAERWAFVERNTKNMTAAFFTDERVESVLPKPIKDAQVEKLTDTGFKSVADRPPEIPPNPPPVNDPVKPEDEFPKPFIDPVGGVVLAQEIEYVQKRV